MAKKLWWNNYIRSFLHNSNIVLYRQNTDKPVGSEHSSLSDRLFSLCSAKLIRRIFPIKKNERKSCIPQHFYPTLHSQRIRETGENPVQSRCCMFFILQKILKEILIPTPYSILATVSAQQPKWEGGATEEQARIPAVATCSMHNNRVFLP